MMLVTTARNDADLRVQLKKRIGDSANPVNIPHGDINFVGKWLGEETCRILIERKKIGDIISCIETGRYLKQVQVAAEAGWKIRYLFAEIERRYREGPRTGLVEIRRGRKWMVMLPEMEWHRIDAFLFEVGLYLGVHVIRTENVRETAKEAVRLYMLFQRPVEEHQTLKKIFVPPRPSEGLLEMFKTPSTARKVAAQIEHIGWTLSKSAEARFGSVRAMVNATEEEWQEIPKIGKKIAGDIVRELETDWRDGSRKLDITDLV